MAEHPNLQIDADDEAYESKLDAREPPQPEIEMPNLDTPSK